MALEEYQDKRDFTQTNEPEGKVGSANSDNEIGLHFVVQKHQASQLHYDFRLQLNGVLKSWAVPKGPSLDPKVKRLAMMVEDHPLDYRNFEGTIPAGNYGAGTVMVWDSGTYHIASTSNPLTTEAVVEEELEKGNVKIVLNGKKLKGEFALVRFKEEPKNWLLIKHKDEYADTVIVDEDKSVLTGRTLDEIAGTAEAA